MKTIAFTQPPSKEFLEIALKKYGLDPSYLGKEGHVVEDAFLVSKKYPIFVVADGVTLIQNLIDKKPYPNPSPAGDVARIFCEACIECAEEVYESFEPKNMTDIFARGNDAVGAYNREHGRTKKTSDYWNNDLFACTVAFVIVKDGIALWFSLCDSYVLHLDAHGEILMRSPLPDAYVEADPEPYTGNPDDPKEKARYTWRVRRNGRNAGMELVGYGVITGEEEGFYYLNGGAFEVKEKETIVLCTDGFGDHFSMRAFNLYVIQQGEQAESELKKFSTIKASENPELFGHERTIIAVTF